MRLAERVGFEPTIPLRGRRFSSLRARSHAQRTRTQTPICPASLVHRIACELRGNGRYCNSSATVPASSVSVERVARQFAVQRRVPQRTALPRRARRMTPTYGLIHSHLVAGSSSRRRRQSRIALQARSISRSSPSIPPRCRRALGLSLCISAGVVQKEKPRR